LVPDITPAEGSLIVNINQATRAQLETVPGIGPGLAVVIIARRPYQSVDELLGISGIGKQTLESMRPFLKTDGETQAR
jgi:competence protein ComEA